MSKSEALFTMTQMATMTGISMPTLVRYKRLYAGKLRKVMVGEGRKARFRRDAKLVLEGLKREGLMKRGHRSKK